MRKNWKNKLFILCVFSIVLLLAGCGQKDTHTHQAGEEYTCPMHPKVVQDKPGSCPICGMDLVKKGGAMGSDTLGNDTLSMNLDYLIRPTNASVISQVRTITPQKKEMTVAVRSSGSIAYDTRRIYNIAARFGGRIEKLYVKYNYQEIKKGQKLFDIYSPALLTAQRELIFLVENDSSNEPLIGGARQKLSLLGLSADQIQAIEKSKRADYTLSVYSPYNGYIVEDAALPSAEVLAAPAANTQGAMGGMNASPTAPATSMSRTSSPLTTSSNEISIREGMYINAGQSLFKVINTDVVWGIFSLYPQDVATLRRGQQVDIIVEGDSSRSIKGDVDFIEPFFREGATLPTFRVNLSNKDKGLQIGSLLNASIGIQKEGLWLPVSALLDLGEKQIAFLKEGEVFSPVAVVSGGRTDGWIEIKGGLREQDVVAANAGFMTDSESFIKVKNDE
jgi:multidrug efflux pump subunit AcrA (membrane-fusion protein)